MNIGFIGCGFASDGYVATLRNHPGLCLAGVADHDRARAELFGNHHSIKVFPSNEALLSDPSIAIVVNRMDFARGISELAESIEESRPWRLSPRMVLHVTELTLALNEVHLAPGRRRIDASFEPMAPMSWASALPA